MDTCGIGVYIGAVINNFTKIVTNQEIDKYWARIRVSLSTTHVLDCGTDDWLPRPSGVIIKGAGNYSSSSAKNVSTQPFAVNLTVTHTDDLLSATTVAAKTEMLGGVALQNESAAAHVVLDKSFSCPLQTESTKLDIYGQTTYGGSTESPLHINSTTTVDSHRATKDPNMMPLQSGRNVFASTLCVYTPV